MGDATNYTQWIMDWFKPYMGERIIEIGLGCGNYSEHLPPMSDYLGVDIDPEIIDESQTKHPDKGYLCMDLANPSFTDAVGRERFDTVICINVLEHIADHEQAMTNMLNVIRAGGCLLIFVPAFRWLYTDLDRLAGHLRRYTAAEFRTLVAASGAEVIRVEYFNPVGAIGWWAQKFVAHDSLEAGKVTSQVELFDKYVLPASRSFNVLTRSFFGQSVIGIARKSNP